MSRRGFVYFTKKGSPNVAMPSNKISNKTALEIRQSIAANYDYIGIRYSTYQERLPDDCIISKAYPQIVQTNKSLFHRVDYSIVPITEENKDTKWLLVHVKPDQLTIPKVYVPISPDQMSSLTANEFLPHISQQLVLEQTPIKLTIDDVDVDLSETVNSIYDKAKEGKIITYHCILSENAINEMKKRKNVVNELIETEKTYINDLDTIIQFWTPNFRKKKILTDYEHNLFFADFPSIIGCQRNFLEDLEKAYDGYATEVAGIFIKFAQYFRIAVTYISNYAQINDMMKEKKTSSSFRRDLEEWADQQNGRDLMSFMITPVQRIPRYKLFLKELMKLTPESHPDMDILKEAANTIEQTNRMIDAESKKAAQMWRLQQIEKNLLNTFKIVVPDRRLILECEVNVKGHSNNRGRIYIFNDIILLTKVQSKGVTVLFDCPSYSFHHIPLDENQLGMIVSAVCKSYNQSIIAPRKDYVVVFPTIEKKTEFFNSLNTVKSEHLQRAEVYLEWSLYKTKPLPPVCANSATSNGKEFLFFGGLRGQQRTPSEALLAVNQFTQEQMEFEAHAAGRFGHTVDLIGSRMFILGGRSKEKFFGKVLCYDLKSGKWSQPIPNCNVRFEPRYGHTSVQVDAKLYIFGGRNQKDSLLNSVTVFDPFKNTFEVFDKLNNAPPARYLHAAAAVGKKIYIHGGKSSRKKVLSDTWELDTETMRWTEKSVQKYTPSPRKCHAMFAIGATLIVLGGCSQNGENVETFKIETESMEGAKVMDVGNVPYALRKFAAIVDRAGRLYAYGGIEQKSKNPSFAFYTLIPASKWLSEMKESPLSASRSITELPLFKTLPRQKRTTMHITIDHSFLLEVPDRDQPKPMHRPSEDDSEAVSLEPEQIQPRMTEQIKHREFARSLNPQSDRITSIVEEKEDVKPPKPPVSYEVVEQKQPEVKKPAEAIEKPKRAEEKVKEKSKPKTKKEKQEELEVVLTNEIPILSSPAFAPPAEREESPEVTLEKAAVSISRPINEVMDSIFSSNPEDPVPAAKPRIRRTRPPTASVR